VCSMYKTPSRFSPHSNFISAELSRYWFWCSLGLGKNLYSSRLYCMSSGLQ
jgi:hypothetical protein